MELRNNPVLTDKEIVDYFQFRYVTNLGVERWVPPDYVYQKASAKKLVGLYGVQFTLELIDSLFDNYQEIFKKKFFEIRWSLGLLSSDKAGWILEKVLLQIKNRSAIDKSNGINELLNKPRNEWTPEDHLLFLQLNSGDKDGKA